MRYVVRRWLAATLYGEVEAVSPNPEEQLLNLPDVPEHWLVGRWYSIANIEGEWGRVDPRQSDLKEISREQFERARAGGWREAP